MTKNDFLKNVIRESIRKILTEDFFDDIDISDIPIEDLKKSYYDYRLSAYGFGYSDVLSEDYIVEAFGDILDADEVVRKIRQKYHLSDKLVNKVEYQNQVFIYIVYASIGDNDKLIEEDMRKMGYFIGRSAVLRDVDGMTFKKCQFEPISQNQKDVTEEIKSKCNVLYHWTPNYNLKSILSGGLTPLNANSLYSYPPRVFLMCDNQPMEKIIDLGQSLCYHNEDNRNNGDYALLKVDLKNLDDSVRLFYDPNTILGVYTEQTIPKSNVMFYRYAQFTTLDMLR